MLDATLSVLIQRLAGGALSGTSVIPWSCPVPAFGDVQGASVATLGLNPSNREFVDEAGKELHGTQRRFPTLRSLGLKHWLDAQPRHVSAVERSCRTYFTANPYDIWFRKLDVIIGRTGASYYGDSANACHLDLIPYATSEKWMNLSNNERRALGKCGGDALGTLLRTSSIRLLILNGRSVVSAFQSAAGMELSRRAMSSWSLPRSSGLGVSGFAYSGTISRFGASDFGREIRVLGFNHNIQSSFGVTTSVIAAIGRWIARET